ncbi:MAG: exonuclease V subunit gamma, partial [Planctomycetota bacterium]
MSTLYLGTDLESLAGKLAEVSESSGADLFAPLTVAVTSPFLGKWLRLWLARKLGVVLNVQFIPLEQAMWEMLKALDKREHALPLALVDEEQYRLMILAALLDPEAAGKELAPLRDYLQREEGAPPRDFCRRAWQLAGRLAGLIRNYEYHRQYVLIQKW